VQTGCVNCASQYKFMGPHIGVLYGKYDLLDRLRAYKVRPAPDDRRASTRQGRKTTGGASNDRTHRTT